MLVLAVTAFAGCRARLVAQPVTSGWTLDRDPVVSLGDVSGEGPELFFDVMAVQRFTDGSLLVADGGTSQLRVFSSAGGHLRTFGGRGDGPGELPGIWKAWVREDTVVVLDVTETVHYFTQEGTFVRLRRPYVSDVGTRIELVGLLGDGTRIGAYEDHAAREVRGDRTQAPLRLVRAREEETEAIASYPGRVRALRGRVRAGPPVIYGPRTFVAVFDERVCAGYSDAYVIDCFDPRGQPLYRIEGANSGPQPRTVTDRDRETYFRGVRAANPTADATYHARVRQATIFAEYVPAFGPLLAGATGELWVGPFVPEDETRLHVSTPRVETHWSVFSAEGAWLSDTVLPARFRPMSAGRGWIAGVRKDELDVEEVVVFRVRRP